MTSCLSAVATGCISLQEPSRSHAYADFPESHIQEHEIANKPGLCFNASRISIGKISMKGNSRIISTNRAGDAYVEFGKLQGRFDFPSRYKRVKGRSHTAEKRKAIHPQKPHATRQPSRFPESINLNDHQPAQLTDQTKRKEKKIGHHAKPKRACAWACPLHAHRGEPLCKTGVGAGSSAGADKESDRRRSNHEWTGDQAGRRRLANTDSYG